MEEAIKECKKEIVEALLSTGNAEQVDELIQISLELLWVTAQRDWLVNNPPKFITLDA